MKLPFWASILMLCGVAILCTLGTWQVQRLFWKQDVLAKLEAEYVRDASQIPLSADDFKESAEDSNEIVFTRGTISGHYLNDKAVKISPKVFEKEIGVHLVTPFELEGGKAVVLVNRGWMPLDHNSADVREVTGQVKLVGMIRSAPQANIFTPANVPEKYQWYIVNVAEIAKAGSLEGVLPKIFYLEELENMHGIYPLVQSGRPEIANNHGQYAVFWFSMALVLVAVFVLRFVRK